MQVRRVLAVGLGVLTLASLVYPVAFLGYFLPKLSTLGQPGGIGDRDYFILFDRVYWLNLAQGMLTISLIVIYSLLIARLGIVPAGRRPNWLLTLVLCHIRGMPMLR